VIRVFIVAASPLARAGLENLLAARGLEIAGSTANTDSLGSHLLDTESEVVLIDTSGEPSESVLDSLAESGLASETALVVLVDHPPPAASVEAVRAGVRAVLPVDVSPDQLIAALQAAVAGLVVFHPREVHAALPTAAPASPQLAELAEPLTRREREVLQMLASGVGNKEIASQLAISEHTVKFHVTSILGKLGASSRTEAVSLAIRLGLILL
jgi:two-component system, NarL family, response regulator YdfI